ncbi:MAG: hypothetical protein ACOYYJ_15245 [Chloroflexota bacterium]
MKPIPVFLGILALLSFACNLTVSASAPTTTLATETETSDLPIPLGTDEQVTYKGLSLILQDNSAPTVTPVDDVIGFVCIGMSNANQECGAFIEKWEQGVLAGKINPQVRFVNCAVGGNAIEAWNNSQRDSELWDACLQQKIPAAGLRPELVRVVWHKAANMLTIDASGASYPPYPDPNADYFRFYENLTTFAARLHEKLPSVQAVYVTSRSYGGFSTKPERGEPLSYEEGLALNQWLADNPTVNGVWFGWGPYIWAPDCATGTVNASGVCYERVDYQADGIHPAQGARNKIVRMLHVRFSQFEWYQP